jgi:hypothetical protein
MVLEIHVMATADELRKLAAWYREFAECARNPAIWDNRLRTAEDLEKEAEHIERRLGGLKTSRDSTQADGL